MGSPYDILVVFNIDKGKINTYGEKELNFDIVKTFDKYPNANGDDIFSYTAVDEEGNKCKVMVTIFHQPENGHVATLRIIYKYGSLIFRLKKDE